MPELPEIETLARDLRRVLVGKTLDDVHAGQPKSLNLPLDQFRLAARGPVEAVDRHGKSAILRLPTGSLWLHMGLGGTVQLLCGALWPAAKFLSLKFAEDCQLAVDKVFMGHAHWVTSGDRPPGGELGIDALDPALTAAHFATLLHRKAKAPVKAALMDQSLLAGVGNTYSDEMLLRARLHPARRCATLLDTELVALHQALQEVLRQAIAQGGEPSWVDIDGQPGRYQFAVHTAKQCARCAGPVQTIAIGGRTAYFCPTCQPPASPLPVSGRGPGG